MAPHPLHVPKVGRLIVVLLGAAMMTNCVAPADPAHVAYAAVVNDCDVAIRAMAAEDGGALPPSRKASELKVIPPHGRANFAAPMYLPVGTTLAVWVLSVAAETAGDPKVVPVGQFDQETSAEGTVTYVYTATGDVCPSQATP